MKANDSLHKTGILLNHQTSVHKTSSIKEGMVGFKEYRIMGNLA